MKNYKLSYYTIFTNPIDDEGNLLVFSSRSGKSIKIHRYTANLLLDGLYHIIPEHQQMILIRNLILVPENESELDAIITENKEEVFEDKTTLYEAIQPTANCQLGCYYCGQNHTKSNLSEEIAGKIVDRIVHKFTKGGYQDILLGWFGAEPLMGLPQMRQINNQLRERLPDVPISAKLVTNGLSLKENIFREMVTDFNISEIEVTLDGIEAFHDQHRYTKAGGGSFELIYKNLKNILLKDTTDHPGCDISIRCNVDEKNVEGVEPLIELLAKDGLHKRISHLYFVPIYSWGGNDAHKKSLGREEMAMYQIQWAIRMVKLGYPNVVGVPGRKKSVCLAVGDTSEMYDAYGNIFNCTEVSYSDHYEGTNYVLGNVSEDHLATYTNRPHSDWFNTVLETKDYPCSTCKIFPICGGGCPKSWKEGMMSCPLAKYNLRSSLELKYLINKTNPSDLNRKLDQFEAGLNSSNFQRMQNHTPKVWI